MDNSITNDIRFAKAREILLLLLETESITIGEYNKALKNLREKNNCKLIVTSPNF